MNLRVFNWPKGFQQFFSPEQDSALSLWNPNPALRSLFIFPHKKHLFQIDFVVVPGTNFNVRFHFSSWENCLRYPTFSHLLKHAYHKTSKWNLKKRWPADIADVICALVFFFLFPLLTSPVRCCFIFCVKKLEWLSHLLREEILCMNLPYFF